MNIDTSTVNNKARLRRSGRFYFISHRHFKQA